MAVLPGLPGVEVALRRSARARRFSLRVSRQTGAVTLTLPAGARESEAMRFLHTQTDWLARALADLAPATRPAHGLSIPLEGRAMMIAPGFGRGVRIEAEQIQVPGDPAQVPARIKAWLRARARDRLAEAVDRHAAALGRKVTAISLRDTRSRWGSCSAEGRLMFSWRLIMAPTPVLDYVAAHEVAHLVEMNHSDRFWAVVERLFPDWKAQRAWLRREGAQLQAIRF